MTLKKFESLLSIPVLWDVRGGGDLKVNIQCPWTLHIRTTDTKEENVPIPKKNIKRDTKKKGVRVDLSLCLGEDGEWKILLVVWFENHNSLNDGQLRQVSRGSQTLETKLHPCLNNLRKPSSDFSTQLWPLSCSDVSSDHHTFHSGCLPTQRSLVNVL